MCGIFGCIGVEEAARLILDGNFCLNHRGQEGAGLAVWNPENEELNFERRFGLASHLKQKVDPTKFKGFSGIGHVRYGTVGKSNIANVQPLVREFFGETLAVAHNGDFIKVEFGQEVLTIPEVKNRLEKDGVVFETTGDTEVIFALIARAPKENIIDKIIYTLNHMIGAFCLLISWRDHLIVARDPWGFHPLWLGKYGAGYVFSSEDCAFGHLNVEPVREIEPGEILVITPNLEVKHFRIERQVIMAFCSFEYVYLARPDSTIFGQSVSKVRRMMGQQTGLEMLELGTLPLNAKVVPILDSGRTSSLGLLEVILWQRAKQMLASKMNPEDLRLEDLLNYGFGVNRNQYSLRNFILADEHSRHIGADLKHNVDRAEVEGWEILECDDSVVRSDTIAKHVARLKRMGATKVHAAIPSPRVVGSCYYGVATRDTTKLVANNLSLEATREKIGADTLHHISLPGFKKCLGCDGKNFCTACFGDQYPIDPD